MDKDFDKMLGDNFRIIRRQMGSTIEGTAEAINISYQQLQKYESGQNRFPLGKLVLALRHLGCPVEMFLESIGVIGTKKDSASTPVIVPQENYLELMTFVSDVQKLSVRARAIKVSAYLK